MIGDNSSNFLHYGEPLPDLKFIVVCRPVLGVPFGQYQMVLGFGSFLEVIVGRWVVAAGHRIAAGHRVVVG